MMLEMSDLGEYVTPITTTQSYYRKYVAPMMPWLLAKWPGWAPTSSDDEWIELYNPGASVNIGLDRLALGGRRWQPRHCSKWDNYLVTGIFF